ncbi:MAG: uL15 family ribosomal protein [Patescibacteria group bacterium]
MQLHTIKREHANKKVKTVGRGGKRGTYSGRGVKGQNARSGHKKRPEIRDQIKKIPKLRGYQVPKIAQKPFVLNLDTLEAAYQSGEKVSPKTLHAKGLLSGHKRGTGIKILGRGELLKKLSFENVIISHSAEEKIGKGGMTISSVGEAKAKTVAK